MIKADSIKCEVSTDALKRVDLNKFRSVNTITNDGEHLSQKYHLKENDIEGLKAITIDHTKESVILEFSAKTLGANYLDGITLNNIEKVFTRIEDANIKLDIPGTIDTAILHKIDITDNLHLSATVKDYIKALSLCRLNSKYEVFEYTSQTVIFKKKVKTSRYKERLICYDKYSEITSDNTLRTKGYFGKLVSDSTNLLRVESNLTSHHAIRKQLNIEGAPLLTNALQSDQKVNANLLDRILKNNEKILQLPMEKQFNDILCEIALNHFEGDMNALETIIRQTTSGGTTYRHLKNFQRIANEREQRLHPMHNEYISDIQNALTDG